MTLSGEGPASTVARLGLRDETAGRKVVMRPGGSYTFPMDGSPEVPMPEQPGESHLRRRDAARQAEPAEPRRGAAVNALEQQTGAVLRYAWATQFREDAFGTREPADRAEASTRAAALELTVAAPPAFGRPADFVEEPKLAP